MHQGHMPLIRVTDPWSEHHRICGLRKSVTVPKVCSITFRWFFYSLNFKFDFFTSCTSNWISNLFLTNLKFGVGNIFLGSCRYQRFFYSKVTTKKLTLKTILVKNMFFACFKSLQIQKYVLKKEYETMKQLKDDFEYFFKNISVILVFWLRHYLIMLLFHIFFNFLNWFGEDQKVQA